MASVRSFHRYRGESSFKMPQFIDILREQIPQAVRSQTRYKVTEIPTARTVRFYTANGLVDKPLGRDGATALYGYRHILQILAIKCLQSQYLPLVKIRSLVENVSNRDLELLIPEITAVSAAHRGIIREDRHIVDNPSIPQRQPVENAGVPADSLDTWHRIDAGPGIELHVHTAALSEEHRERLRGALLREIGVLRGWFKEEKH